MEVLRSPKNKKQKVEEKSKLRKEDTDIEIPVVSVLRVDSFEVVRPMSDEEEELEAEGDDNRESIRMPTEPRIQHKEQKPMSARIAPKGSPRVKKTVSQIEAEINKELDKQEVSGSPTLYIMMFLSFVSHLIATHQGAPKKVKNQGFSTRA